MAPKTLSPQAQVHLAARMSWAPEQGSPEQLAQIALACEMYPVEIEDATMAGVPVKIVQPRQANAAMARFFGRELARGVITA